jgi:hypothetical protein
LLVGTLTISALTLTFDGRGGGDNDADLARAARLRTSDLGIDWFESSDYSGLLSDCGGSEGSGRAQLSSTAIFRGPDDSIVISTILIYGTEADADKSMPFLQREGEDCQNELARNFAQLVETELISGDRRIVDSASRIGAAFGVGGDSGSGQSTRIGGRLQLRSELAGQEQGISLSWTAFRLSRLVAKVQLIQFDRDRNSSWLEDVIGRWRIRLSQVVLDART